MLFFCGVHVPGTAHFIRRTRLSIWQAFAGLIWMGLFGDFGEVKVFRGVKGLGVLDGTPWPYGFC